MTKREILCILNNFLKSKQFSKEISYFVGQAIDTIKMHPNSRYFELHSEERKVRQYIQRRKHT